MSANLERVRAAWAKAPDWVDALADACDRSSQGKVAAKLGISGAAVNQVLANCYKGRVDRVAVRVRGEFMQQTVVCPVLGELSTRRCLDEQRRPFASTNMLRDLLNRACPKCKNREGA